MAFMTGSDVSRITITYSTSAFMSICIGDSDFEQEALNTHNKYRKTHGVPDMTLSRDLSNQAKAYAQKIANMGQLMHSSQAERGDSVGENLAYACSSNGTPLTGASATKMWYVVIKQCIAFSEY